MEEQERKIRYSCKVKIDGELMLIKVTEKSKEAAEVKLRNTYQVDEILDITKNKISLFPKTDEYYYRKLESEYITDELGVLAGV